MADSIDGRVESEFLILGSGIAGLSAAIKLSKKGRKSTVVTKSRITDANTYHAQGGITAVDPVRVENGEDSFESLARNTMAAGDGICDPGVVENFSKNAYEAVDFLMKQGVEFSRAEGDYPYRLHQEGGHDFPRIYCVGDFIGKAIEETLAARVMEDKNITVLENHTVINLITRNWLRKDESGNNRCVGAYAIDKESGKVRTLKSDVTFLATGGAGRAFQYTSNPENATGDGIAMAFRAGARLANMEFFQFHPSVFYEESPADPSERRFLLTEALRGEKNGGILTLSKGSVEDFVLKYDPRGSYATRDIVARAIDTEMKKGSLNHVWLNVTTKVSGKSAEFLENHFPKIYEHCLSKGIDIAKEPIPVIPAAHYTCGGVVVNQFGQTDIRGLYAIGEVACTGLMGANRLASNSLSEGALYGQLAVAHALSMSSQSQQYGGNIPEWSIARVDKKADKATLNQGWDNLRRTMMTLCGIDRNEERLKMTIGSINGLLDGAEGLYQHRYPSHEVTELRNLALVSKLIASSALYREESRGGHYRSDFPDKNDALYKGPTILRKSPDGINMGIAK